MSYNITKQQTYQQTQGMGSGAVPLSRGGALVDALQVGAHGLRPGTDTISYYV